MLDLALERLELLHDGVTEITLTDFPDHSNVGDSAIALGEFRFWGLSKIRVNGVFSGPNITNEIYRTLTPHRHSRRREPW